VNGNGPGQYVAAWRHVHDIFTSVGATNATWVWCPFSDPKQKLRDLRSLYPGDSYVDWTCMDGYNWGKNAVNPQPWRSFDQIFALTYKRLIKAVAPTKPVLVAEFASSPNGGHKALWIRDTLTSLPVKYPRIRGMIWLDGFDRGIDWPIETSVTATRAFAAGIRKGVYQVNRYAELATSPIRPPH
jgi:mannan endo-1,4-beta-mannosidase